ncbi:hypothetical protein B0H65DRAFT_569870 [Neurospora tetraspora]|uniref:Uncharacterized protein n=1 Tax=Neurospora tetraspora TaxID=94610 RepID=A0AAE0JM15_9PEZI|nr:hypothetical protein B0H65DRAFT_569870 [Neurospora tetraspora]
MTSTSSRVGLPAPSIPPANLQVQTDTSTQTDDGNMESADSSFQRSSAPSPSPTLSSLPPASFPTPTTTSPVVRSDLEPSPSIYSPRPEPLTSSADATRSSSPIGVGPTRPGSPARLVPEDEPLIPEAPSSPVLAHSVPVPVPVGAMVNVPNVDPHPDPDPEPEPDQTSETTAATTTTHTLTHPTAATTATTAETEDPVASIPSPTLSPNPRPQVQTQLDTDIDTDMYIINPNTPNPIPNFPNHTTIGSLPNYGHFPPYGRGVFFPDSDLQGYTLTEEGEGYWPPYGHVIISVRVGSWVYRYISRLPALPAVTSDENNASTRESPDGE